MAVMLSSVIVGLSLPGWWRLTAAAIPVLYGVTLLAVGVVQSHKTGWRVAILFPVAVAIMHVAYAMGFVLGIMKKGTDRIVQSSGGSATKEHVMSQEPNAATFFNSFAEA